MGLLASAATQTQRKLNVDVLNQLKIPKGKLWGDLQQGQNIEWNGQSVLSQDVLIQNTQSVYAIVGGDNDQPELLSNACQDAALLIHETTYTQSILDKVGAGPMHSSAKMVAEFAESIQLPNLIATHLSARYHDAQDGRSIVWRYGYRPLCRNAGYRIYPSPNMSKTKLSFVCSARNKDKNL
ncbi:unnamed protein product [Oppiella nova]|uniref:Metallo-beta-lactamase domain-containing protein n=1 Tax=Oppiella nova TaxID=334625 RepID=A0A7R9L8S9_9ACAR|nr:unnamed protein product [Oppiella nova]CAG2159746.1 unnamed protein product [Oppiella nova]